MNSQGRYANFIKDSFIAELTDIDRSLMLSIDADPIPMDQAVRQGESKLLAVETNISNWQRKQNQNNNFSAAIPYDMERQREESREFLNDLVARDQRMIPALITLVHSADSKEQLDADTESILQCARKHLCSMSVLRWQQLEGLNTCLPYGGSKLGIRRTLTTESLAVFMPFHVQEVCHKNGLYIGNNAISKNMIMVNRGELLNGNSFITGVSGSGKSMMAKQELTSLLLSDKNADVIVIDPEREYTLLTEAFGGETVVVSATSNSHINAMAMSRDYADGANPVTLKSEFILSLCEQVMNGGLGAKEKSIIDRCTAIVYRDYMLGGCVSEPPTLKDFREVLLQQSEVEAQDIALAIELFTDGSLNTFAKQTNVNTRSRFICYDIHELGKQLMPIGMLVVLDSILNRITENRAKGRKTYIFIDEIPKQLIPHLREIKKRSTSKYVVGNGSKNITVRSYQRSFELLLQKQKIPHHGFHALRHTFATRAIECGMDVKSLSEILGHKNPTITLKRYVHSFMEHKREFMNRLGKLL